MPLTKQIEFKDMEIKFSKDKEGVFSGWASKFNGIDSYNDTIVTGAFGETLNHRSDPVAMLWMHDPKTPIGQWTKLEEKSEGLWVEGELCLDHSVASDAYSLLKEGIVSGLSIGFSVKDSEVVDGVRNIKSVDLVEISLVQRPADKQARVEEIKQEVEDWLDQEHVLSLEDATTFANLSKLI